MSGGYDLAVFVECASSKSRPFRLGTHFHVRGVLSTATHFILKNIKSKALDRARGHG
ncbi:MAG: hypothetical protein ACLRSW_04400 [Christensenellaceae bacterium]